jgi:nucleoside-diphosphate-sugar epimerase
MSKERYLVTGGTGFIGSYITNKLVSQNKDVYIFALSDKENWRIDEEEKVNILYGDISNFDRINSVVREINPTFIFHLAAYVNVDRDLSAIDKAIDINFRGTLNLLKALNEIDYKLLINTGTCEEYGIGEVPFVEDQKEHPVSPYSFSKTTNTYLCELFANIYKMPIITVRPFLTYGPKQVSNMLIPQLIYSGINSKKLELTSGEQTRDFIFVEDVADAYIKFSENYKKIKKHEIFNIGTGLELKIRDVVKIISSYFPDTNFELGALNYRKGETMNFYSSSDKIKSLLQWEPNYNFKEGIKKTISWWTNSNIWRNQFK